MGFNKTFTKTMVNYKSWMKQRCGYLSIKLTNLEVVYKNTRFWYITQIFFSSFVDYKIKYQKH